MSLSIVLTRRLTFVGGKDLVVLRHLLLNHLVEVIDRLRVPGEVTDPFHLLCRELLVRFCQLHVFDIITRLLPSYCVISCGEVMFYYMALSSPAVFAPISGERGALTSVIFFKLFK